MENSDAALWYPVQYEGFERSPNTFYSGNTINQQADPIIEWCLQNNYSRVSLIGSDYNFPRMFNRAFRAIAANNGLEIVSEQYIPFTNPAELRGRSLFWKNNADIVVNTVNGDGNKHLFKQIEIEFPNLIERPQVISTSLTESETFNDPKLFEGSLIIGGLSLIHI